MKTVLRVLSIIVVTAIVAGGWYLVVEHTSLLASSQPQPGILPSGIQRGTEQESGQDFENGVNDESGVITPDQMFRPGERDEGGGEFGGQMEGGLSGLFETLLKVVIICAVVYLIQKVFQLFGFLKVKWAKR